MLARGGFVRITQNASSAALPRIADAVQNAVPKDAPIVTAAIAAGTEMGSFHLGHLRNKVVKMVQAAPSMQIVPGTLMAIS
jgi:hypothetical protein